MRFLILVAVLLACLLGVAWIGGEAWLAKRSRLVIDKAPQIQAQDVTPLRELHRIGMQIDRPVVQAQGPLTQVDLPWLDLWVAPSALTTLNVTLPDTATVTLGGTALPVAMQDAELRAKIAPLHEFVLSEAGLKADSLALNDQMLAEGVSIAADLTSLGANAPLAARSAYDLTIGLDRGTADLLALLAPQLAGTDLSVGASGQVQVFLDGSLYRDVLTGAAPRPHVVGVQSDGVSLNINDGRIVLSGGLTPDANGLVQGQVRISGNRQAIVEALRIAVMLGYLPDSAMQVGATVAGGIAMAEAGMAARAASSDLSPVQERVAADAAADAAVSEAPEPAQSAPAADAAPGLTIHFEDGAIMIGQIRIGAAPAWRG